MPEKTDCLVVSIDLLLPITGDADPQEVTVLVQQMVMTLQNTYGVMLKNIAGYVSESIYDAPADGPSDLEHNPEDDDATDTL